jgi:hypothetical protein
MEISFINLTPHTINVETERGRLIIPSSGVIARAESTSKIVGTIPTENIGGIKVVKTVYGKVINLPEPKVDTIYIVSALTAQACREREDVFVPGEAVRDEDGRIIACKGLAHV